MQVLHVGYQIDIMCQTVTDMPIIDKEQLRFFIKRHQDIIIFTEKIEKYFTYIALSQLFTNTLVTCCLGVMIVIVFTTGGGAILVMKYLMFFVNIWVEAILCDMLSTIEEECKKYAFIDKTGLILKTIHVSYRLTTSIIVLYVMVAIIHIIGNATSAHSNETYSLILKMDLPFEINKSPNYELVLTAQIFHQTYTAFTFSVYSALILMVVLHVGCQIDILCQTIIDVPLRDKKQLEFFISRHQDIIVFTEKIEQFFTYMALSQLLSNILITCCLGFLIIMSISGDAELSVFFKSVSFYIALWIEAYVYCFAGEYLNTKILKASASYMSVLLAMS
nr:PREDICTED: uncharacterized protein LOC100884046 [Megachile rotundata]